MFILIWTILFSPDTPEIISAETSTQSLVLSLFLHLIYFIFTKVNDNNKMEGNHRIILMNIINYFNNDIDIIKITQQNFFKQCEYGSFAKFIKGSKYIYPHKYNMSVYTHIHTHNI